jgi:hypothetical protein
VSTVLLLFHSLLRIYRPADDVSMVVALGGIASVFHHVSSFCLERNRRETLGCSGVSRCIARDRHGGSFVGAVLQRAKIDKGSE